MTLVDPKDHILKLSVHYLYFWLIKKFVPVVMVVTGGWFGSVGRVVFYGYKDQPGLINIESRS
jgi:hypothetical protein